MPEDTSNKIIEDTQCGFFCWKGGIWQKCASIKVYALVYGLMGLIQFALGSYMVAIITTIEKRFKIRSRTSGLIMSSWDIGSLICLIALAYVGSKGHKPRWVAAGNVVIALSGLLWLFPHYIYGPVTPDYLNTEKETGLCEMGSLSSEICTEGEESKFSSILFCLANFILGIGGCVYFTLGVAYLDDNTRKDKMPWLLSVTMLIRMCGPTLGFVLGSYALSIYNDPSVDPGINKEDPRWIGAWWFGWVPLIVLNLLLAILMWPFPRYLPRAYQRKLEAGELYKKTKLSFKDFKATLARLLRNKILMFNSISSTFYMFAMTGYWNYMPKYLETQFQQSASKANLITGSVGLICTGLGVLASGFVISHFKPKAKTLALWNVIVEFIDVIGYTAYAFLGCPSENLFGHWENDVWSLKESCNAACACPPTVKYDPLCSQDGRHLFYSPCHAGCLTGSFNQTLNVYENCSCSPGVPLAPGPCPLQCSTNFNMFLLILCTMRFFAASGRAGNTIIQFRSVSEADKSVSIGFSEAMVAACAFIPGAIVFGSLLDKGCLVWGRICGEEGNCWLYNGQTVRYYINLTSAGFILLATVADIGVWKYSSDLKIYDNEDTKIQELKPLNNENGINNKEDPEEGTKEKTEELLPQNYESHNKS